MHVKDKIAILKDSKKLEINYDIVKNKIEEFTTLIANYRDSKIGLEKNARFTMRNWCSNMCK